MRAALGKREAPTALERAPLATSPKFAIERCPTAHARDYRIVMHPDRASLHLAIFAFIVLVPMVWFTLRGLMALVG
jgi:hypothetical protein